MNSPHSSQKIETQEADRLELIALLKILALGNQQIADGKVRSASEVIQDLTSPNIQKI